MPRLVSVSELGAAGWGCAGAVHPHPTAAYSLRSLPRNPSPQGGGTRANPGPSLSRASGYCAGREANRCSSGPVSTDMRTTDNNSAPGAANPDAPAPIGFATSLLFAIACGALAGNIYYAQPLVARDLGCDSGTGGWCIATQWWTGSASDHLYRGGLSIYDSDDFYGLFIAPIPAY